MNTSSVSGVRFEGPLTSSAAGFATELARLGYTSQSTVLQLRLVAHLSRWMVAEGFELDDLGPEVVESFVAARREGGYSVHRTAAALDPLLGFLEGMGALGESRKREDPVLEGPVEKLLDCYRSFLRDDRELGADTVVRYVAAVRPFVAGLVVDGELDLGGLTAGQVSRFILEVAGEQKPGKAKTTATALRSLLRFLHVEGMVTSAFGGAVPSVASQRLASLPRGLTPAEVSRLLAACDRRTSAGRRDYAIMLLLLRLGLRAGDVAGLRLDDIDWRSGELTVVGKGGRPDRLPLPHDVGEAIVAYLRKGRPSTAQGRSSGVRQNGATPRPNAGGRRRRSRIGWRRHVPTARQPCGH